MSDDADAREMRRLLLIAVLVLLVGEGGLAAIAVAKVSRAPALTHRSKHTITAPAPH